MYRFCNGYRGTRFTQPFPEKWNQSSTCFFLHPRTTSFSMLYFRFHAHECMHPLLSLFSSPALSACRRRRKPPFITSLGRRREGGKNPAMNAVGDTFVSSEVRPFHYYHAAIRPLFATNLGPSPSCSGVKFGVDWGNHHTFLYHLQTDSSAC